MQIMVDDLRAKVDRGGAGGGAAASAKHVARGKLLPRDRVADAARPGHAVPRDSASSPPTACTTTTAPAAGIITGIGRVAGRECMIVVQRRHGEGRHLLPDDGEEAPARAGDRRCRTACRASTWSTPAAPSCRMQDEVFPDREHFGRIFYNQANMSAPGHPADRRGDGLVHRRRRLRAGDVRRERSSCKNQGTIFLGGPPLVKAATGEVVTAEELGGGDVHTRMSGVADHLAEDDAHALAIARAHRRQPEPHASRSTMTLREPASSRCIRPKELYGVIPADTAQALRRARGDRAHRRRPRVRRVQGALRHHAGHRLRAHPRHAGRHHRQQRHPVLASRR